MRQPRTHASDDPVGLLVSDLQMLRKGTGLTRSKAARATSICRLPVVATEATRLGRSPADVCYALVAVATNALKHRDAKYLSNALVVDGQPAGRNLSDRRSRFGLSESQVREHEDMAIIELARWLLSMTNPAAQFGDYLAPIIAVPAPPPSTADPVGPDDLHPLGEVVWDHIEKTCVLNDLGHALYTETRGTLRALIPGVTGYSLFYTNEDNPAPKHLRVILGGVEGRHFTDVLGGYAVNINFLRPLQQHQSLRLHWILELPTPVSGTSPQRGLAHAADVQTRHLTLRVHFDERKLPVAPCSYEARPRFLMRPLGAKRPLDVKPGGLIEYPWPITEEGMAYILQWLWPEDLKTVALTE